MLPVALLFAVSTLSTDSILRSGCEEDETEIARLPAGQTVEVKSKLSGGSGACFKVTASLEGKQVTGYVPVKSVRDTATFEEARRGGLGIGGATPASSTAQPKLSVSRPKAPKDHPASKAWDLIEANQPAEALRLLEKDLQRYPNDAYLLAVAGMAFYRMDNLDRAVQHWREAYDIDPQPGIKAMIDRAERERGADKGSERMVGNRVVVRYERGSLQPELARAMLDVLDQEYTRVSFELGCRATEKVTAVLQSPESYRRATAAAEWSGGLYDGRIHVPVSPSRNVTAEQHETFAHELVHACLHELGAWPGWVHEGLAQKFSRRSIPPQARQLVAEMIKRKALPRLSQLGPTFSGMSAQHASVAYTYAYVAAEKLLELFAASGLHNFLRNPGDLARNTAQVETALGF